MEAQTYDAIGEGLAESVKSAKSRVACARQIHVGYGEVVTPLVRSQGEK